MRHRQNTQNLSRFSTYYKATIKSLAQAVIINKKIITTKLRAKLARRLVDNLITLGKRSDSIAARRIAFSHLNSHSLVKELFSEIAPMFLEKTGGYTRIIPYKRRRGDNAEMVVLELSVQVVKAPVVIKDKAVAKKEDDTDVKNVEIVEKPQRQQKHKEIAPPEKEKHKKDIEKPFKKSDGGLGKFFKPKRDSK